MTALAPDRSCGSCTVCCRVLEVAALAKPAGTLCRHDTGAACGVYVTRPQVCARWFCLWRKVGALPDALRPDRSGVLFSLDSRAPLAGAPEEACIVGRVVGETSVRDRQAVDEAFAMFVREGSLPVWRVSDRRAVRLRREQGDGDPS